MKFEFYRAFFLCRGAHNFFLGDLTLNDTTGFSLKQDDISPFWSVFKTAFIFRDNTLHVPLQCKLILSHQMAVGLL